MDDRILLFLGIVVLLSFSCQKDKINQKRAQHSLTFIDIIGNVNSPNRKATISFFNYQGNFHEDAWSEYTNARVTCREGSEICDAGKVRVNEFELEFDKGYEPYTSSEYKSVFGGELNISFTEGGTDGHEFDDINIYVPKALDVDLDGIYNPGLSLKDGMMINWNADPQNANGVYIIMEYMPFENERLMKAYPDRKLNYINVSDSGSYTYSKSDFPDIPDTALVLLRIVRGVVELQEVNGEEVAVYVITQVAGYARAWQ
ncbi:MAG: hypothetical protein MI974_14680 [Chitinophagales bacterium]|nr:hypothetical protein [Chitinophagales bacterium]